MAARPLAVGNSHHHHSSSIGGSSGSHSSHAAAAASGTETYVSKEEVDRAVSLYFQASKERQELEDLAETLADALMGLLDDKEKGPDDHDTKRVEGELERAREAEAACAKKVAELQKQRNRLGVARARIIAAQKKEAEAVERRAADRAMQAALEAKAGATGLRSAAVMVAASEGKSDSGAPPAFPSSSSSSSSAAASGPPSFSSLSDLPAAPPPPPREGRRARPAANE